MNNSSSFNVEIRADSVLVSGYVNAVERHSRLIHDRQLGDFIEQVRAGVFSDAIDRAESVGLMFNHVRAIGDTESCLELTEDAIGLHATATITDPEIIEKAKANALRGWSFGFRSLQDSWSMTDTGQRLRTLEKIDLFEVSILDCTPAYIATSIEARNLENAEYRCTNEFDGDRLKNLRRQIEILSLYN